MRDTAIPAAACDVLVIGGGPAGSTAAALLAMRGVDVVLLEKARHPRFHIGESLLPRNLAILERLGVRAEVEAIGVFKPGAEFVSDATGASVAFPFSHGLDRDYQHAYQVLRADFDTILFRNAAAKGARCLELTRVIDVTFGGAGGTGGAGSARAQVSAVDGDGRTLSFSPRFVLDASGRDTFMAQRERSKQANKYNNTAAVFAHYRDVERREGQTRGYISVHLAEDGWFWLIPLPDGIMSVGFVGNQAAFKQRQGGMEDFLAARIRGSATVAPRMANAVRVSEVHSTGNYSYSCRRAWGEGWFMIGDAFAFIDPVFSSGVQLAMTAAERGADVAQAWLRDPASGRVAARAAEKRMRAAMRGVSWLIYRINDKVMRMMFMSPHNRLRMRDGVITILAGNLAAERGARLPILAFKTTYYLLRAMQRLGWRLPGGGQARV